MVGNPTQWKHTEELAFEQWRGKICGEMPYSWGLTQQKLFDYIYMADVQLSRIVSHAQANMNERGKIVGVGNDETPTEKATEGKEVVAVQSKAKKKKSRKKNEVNEFHYLRAN